jgi:predicted transcriptional regulator YdeE
MGWVLVDEPGFTVVGIAGRTSNAREMSGDRIIAKQWGRFWQENLLALIPDKADEAVRAVYTEYASDKDGDYTFVIGARVKSAAGIPVGMVSKTIPAGRNAVFLSESGPVERIVVETWQRIWSSAIDRAYGADYEIYDQRAADPSNAQVEVCVGVREF